MQDVFSTYNSLEFSPELTKSFSPEISVEQLDDSKLELNESQEEMETNLKIESEISCMNLQYLIGFLAL